MDTGAVVTVIDPRGKSHQIIGRSARMIRQILLHADQINAQRWGSLSFRFGDGEKVKPEWREEWEDTG